MTNTTSGTWGIDLGGTKIEGVVLDPGGAVLVRMRRPTEAHEGYARIIENVARLVRDIGQQLGSVPARIGIGTPGSIDPLTETMKNCNTTNLNGMPLHDDLQAALGIPVVVANDANCFTLAEARLGAAREFHSVFGVIMGTGVGGGIALGGTAIEGRNGIAGEWGHNVLDPGGAPCYCGKRGCVETVISGPAIEAFHAEHTGTKSSLREIAERSAEPSSQLTLEHLFESTARALAVVVNILDPDIVVLGGGVSNVAGLAAEVESRLAKHVFNTSCVTKVTKNELGDSAGVFGAAMLVR